MKNVIKDKLQEIEEEYDRPTTERIGKVLLVGLVALLASTVAEAAYDHFTIERRKKKLDTNS